MPTVPEHAAALEVLRRPGSTSVEYARVRHKTATAGLTALVLDQVVIIENPASTESQRLAACTTIRSLMGSRDNQDVLMKDRLTAWDAAAAALHAALAAHQEPGFGRAPFGGTPA